MKAKYIFLLLIFIVFKTQAQNKQYADGSALQYFVREKLLSGYDKRSIILIPLSTEDIKDYSNPNTDVKYWSILQTYYPELSKDSMKKMVDKAPILSEGKISGLPNVVILKNPATKTFEYNYDSIIKMNGYTHIDFISNLIYSKDLKTCILYVYSYSSSCYTVEIKQDESGHWYIYKVTTDWIA
jgi:hypothetical protein